MMQLLLIGGDFLLLAVLLVNGWRLYQTYLQYRNVLTGNLLSSHPEEFIDKITATGTPVWAWVVEIGALTVTAGLLVVWFFPKLRIRLRLTWINGIWLVLWMGYFIFLVILGIVVLNSLIRFT